MSTDNQEETSEKQDFLASLSDISTIFRWKDEGKKYLDAETAAYQLKQSKSRDSETKWLKTALQQGTASDKIAASIVLVQDNPKCNLGRLASLVSQVRAAKHNQCRMIITSLKELFLNHLLDPETKLLKFEEQEFAKLYVKDASESILKSKAVRNQLALWYFEDQLREHYERFISNLSVVASSTVDTSREIAITTIADLLIGNSEQEHKLLELLVNKIGDPSHKVGSKAVFCIDKVLHEHPNMKFVILREIEKLIFRKNVSQRTQYYAICLLIKFVLDKENDEKIADTLLHIYFALFKACLKKGEPDSRMMAAILMGVNRAYPFAKVDSEILLEHINSVYKVVHLKSFNVSLNALCLLHQVTMKDKSQGNRFYSAFYRKLLDPQVGVATKRAMFLNLLYRVLANDQSIVRLYAFIKRILQITLYFPANMACATLYVISKILRKHKDLTRMFVNSNTNIKVEEDACEIKVEDDSNETDNGLADVENVHIIEGTKPRMKDDIILSNVAISTEVKSDVTKQTGSENETENIKMYDPFCRNPLYAGATKEICTELRVLANHFHPSVALFANLIIEGKPIEYTGDPLEDLTLIRFLDRYVFKNPKKLENKKVQKKNEPLAQRDGYTPKGVRSLPVDSAAYLNEAEKRIPVDEVFLYRYFKQRNQIKNHIKKDDDDDDDDLDSVNSEEFNDVLDRMSGNKELDDVDIAADIVPRRKTKSKVDEDFDDDDKDDENSSDEDGEENISEDFTEDNSASDDNQDFSSDELIPVNSNKKIKSSKTKERKTRKGADNIFVSAEKFATMLEEQTKSKRKYGGSNAFSTRDGASEKQIDWEMKRLQKVKGSLGKRKRKPVANKEIKRHKR